MEKVALMTTEEISQTMIDALNRFEEMKTEKDPPGLFSINKVSKILGRSHTTIKKLVKNGIIKTTKDGMITEQAINEYLNNE